MLYADRRGWSTGRFHIVARNTARRFENRKLAHGYLRNVGFSCSETPFSLSQMTNRKRIQYDRSIHFDSRTSIVR